METILLATQRRFNRRRRLIEAALEGTLARASCRSNPIFRFEVPTECAGLAQDTLDPASYWPDEEAYSVRVRTFAEYLKRNFVQFENIDRSVREAGPGAV
jgi:phosphoenolpyruvate carboxykinase (ATP)